MYPQEAVSKIQMSVHGVLSPVLRRGCMLGDQQGRNAQRWVSPLKTSTLVVSLSDLFWSSWKRPEFKYLALFHNNLGGWAHRGPKILY